MISGYYGRDYIPCHIFVSPQQEGYWYAIEGSCNVNFTYEELEDGVYLERIQDIDCFHCDEPIESIVDLENALEN